ncbi:hypothetical protein K469DRAFT_156410 [Zopfia rhizophila CBS 207.26]|uniref:Uncharacterized protein n=1 Tax=Zopfia rhizophila CBS 207.26 TaxID=1314779 RepID=A0A6A6E5H0_9PEZI|nr:hypothetical protein K469DRAFT_156410 [Zopfia rhizophila CBS 207.26]
MFRSKPDHTPPQHSYHCILRRISNLSDISWRLHPIRWLLPIFDLVPLLTSLVNKSEHVLVYFLQRLLLIFLLIILRIGLVFVFLLLRIPFFVQIAQM